MADLPSPGSEQARLALERAGDPVYWIASDARIVWANQAASLRVGYSRVELAAQTLFELEADLSRDAWELRWRELRQRGALRCEGLHKTREGRLYPIELTLTLVADGAGEVALAVARDETERRAESERSDRAREAAEAATRAKSEFLASMSHEIRTPMNGILGMTELALGTRLDDEQREYLEAARASAESLLCLLNDILDLSKIEAGRIDLDPIEFALRASVEDSVRGFGLRAAEQSLELGSAVAPDVPDALVGDPGRLRQVLVNLVGNAVKFTRTGEVFVRVELVSEQADAALLRFAVQDTGIGVPPEARPHIFEPFAQGDRATQRRFGGTGLGLSISRRLVDLMGGELGFESEVGRGSTFWFTARFAVQVGAPRLPLPRAELGNRRTLVVDDHPEQRRSLSAVATELGLRAESAPDAREALAALRRARASDAPFELLLCDAHMPGLDGFGLVEALRAEGGVRPVVVLLTSAGARGDAARCRALGIEAYLTKPVARADLARAVESALGLRDSDAQRRLITRHVLREGERRLRVLVAEDNQTNRRWLERTLAKRGHTVVLAEDGREAVRRAARERFDLLLMDLSMPELDGIAATREIRAHERRAGGRLPILALTAHAMREDQARCVDAGMDGYVSKPIRGEELFAAIEGVLGRRPAPERRRAALDPAVLVDENELLERVDGDRELLLDLVELFFSDLPQRLRAAEAAVASSDAAEVERIAHGLAGAIGNLAAHRALARALAREARAAAREQAALAPALDELRRELALLKPALHALVDKPDAAS